jgi:hypothetical protein
LPLALEKPAADAVVVRALEIAHGGTYIMLVNGIDLPALD